MQKFYSTYFLLHFPNFIFISYKTTGHIKLHPNERIQKAPGMQTRMKRSLGKRPRSFAK